jgi:hypothetical protein
LEYPQADLVVKVSDLLAELSVAEFNFSALSCSVVEGCVGGVGRRRLLRFSVSLLNQGQADVVLSDPAMHPLSFHFSPCHQHFHYHDVAEYSLISNGKTDLVGHKSAFCLEDTTQQLVGRHIPCLPRFNCTHPGIQRGWSDYYGADLDCQWIDVTHLPAGEYSLRVEVNQARIIAESSFDNNGPHHTPTPHSHGSHLHLLSAVVSTHYPLRARPDVCSGGGQSAAPVKSRVREVKRERVGWRGIQVKWTERSAVDLYGLTVV